MADETVEPQQNLDQQVQNRQQAVVLRNQKRLAKAIGRGRSRSAKNLPTNASLRQRKRRAGQNKKQQNAESEVLNTLGAPVRQGTDWLLRQSWINVIDSWGLTLLWVNAHVLLRFMVGPEFFSKLGHEWAGGAVKGGLSSKEFKAVAEQEGDKIGVVEVLTLLAVDLLILLLLFLIVIIICVAVGIIQHPICFFGRPIIEGVFGLDLKGICSQ